MSTFSSPSSGRPTPRLESATAPASSMAERMARDLTVIARVMDRAAGFPAVSPGGWVALGAVGIAGGGLVNELLDPAAEPGAWVAAWMLLAVLAAPLGIFATVARARATNFSLTSRPARGFWVQLLSPLVVGLVLTVLWTFREAWELVPGTWLVFYGLGLVGGGSLCRRAVRAAGLAFLVLGLAAYLWPAFGGTLLCTGFGGVHLVTGWRMAEHDLRTNPSNLRGG